MRKLLLSVACAILCGWVNAAEKVTANVNGAAVQQSVAPLQVVTLDIEFSTYPDHFQFHCMNADEYGVEVIDIYIHHVDIYFYDGTVNLDATAWIQMQNAGMAGYSEVVPCRLTPDTYVDLSTIQVTGNPDYIYEFNITGIPVR